ncbi:NADP-dependent oxidoreductase [Bradyrhizobium sp. 48]|uniref:NADP-dependent oxidoreductase n=1 Tax=Bradyrhizobium sp. 48 TaxID=2782676 RepID=UPI001FF7BDBF|nr:NADP-dependent oxidoreductase [Bradyrhizobium sp. 48]MCK1446762.1 NADP-dependent oxidoreductase [Bradyrhizobium sp. 48]
MKNNRNRQVVLKSRPADIPQAHDFEIVESEVPDLLDRQILVQNVFLSVEPAMRGWVSNVANYSEPVRIGEVMRSFAAGEVLQSAHPDFKPGDKVMGMFGWQEFAVVGPAAVTRKVQEDDLPVSLSLGVTGLNGITAYFGLLDIGQPRPGDTVVVSTAAGAVGSAAGQIAKLSGCRTVGIAGGSAKVAQCRELFGYDEAYDYKSDNLDLALGKACPRGIDLYFDNTGGVISDTVLRHLAVGARVVICGTASFPTWDPWPNGPRTERHLLIKRARMEGFVIFDYASRYEEAVSRLSQWIRDGRLRYSEDIQNGIECAPAAIAGLYRGENTGKRLIRIR